MTEVKDNDEDTDLALDESTALFVVDAIFSGVVISMSPSAELDPVSCCFL
jgi:hypothetical protein